jgi:hypothetical protein
MLPYTTFWDYDSTRDGQVAVGTVTSPWFDATGIDGILIRTLFTGGTTQIFVDQNREGPEAATTGAALVSSANVGSASSGDAGADVPVDYRYVRIRIVQTVSSTTNAQLSAKGTAG